MEESYKDRRILVVDDEERMVRFIRLNLEYDGFQVLEAFNGSQAINKIRSNLPDLVLLDVMLPDFDGFEVLRMIREVSTVPVIMLTAKGEEEDRVRGLEISGCGRVGHSLGAGPHRPHGGRMPRSSSRPWRDRTAARP